MNYDEKSILRKHAKNEKIYSNNLLTEYAYKLEAYRK